MFSPEVLILGPGGSKGFLEIGSAMCLDNAGHLRNIKEVCGVSVGSIIGLLWVCGYSWKKIARICLEFNLFDESFSNNFILSRVTETWGALSHSKIKLELEKRVSHKLGLVPDFAGLYQATGKKFMCVTSNLTRSRSEYLSVENNPGLNVVNGVLMSINIPVFFERIIVGEDIYIDGALRDPCPTAYYDNGKRDILILYVNSHTPRGLGNETGMTGFLKFAMFSFDSSMDELYQRSRRAASNRCRFLCLTAQAWDTVGISLTPQMRISMIATGYTDTLRILRARVDA